VIKVVASSTLLGLYSTGVTFIVFHIFKLWGYSDEVMATVVFLALSISSVGTVFLTRTDGLCFLSLPGLWLVVSAVAAEAVVTLFAALGVLMPAIGWSAVGIIWGISLVSLLVKDLLKLGVNALMSDSDGFCLGMRGRCLKLFDRNAREQILLPI